MTMRGTDIPAHMLRHDPFSTWLGIEIIEQDEHKVTVAMTVKPQMLNSMGYAHGGIAYSLADTAFGFTANMPGRRAVSIETSINHITALSAGDQLTATCLLQENRDKLGFHIIEVRRGDELVALFKGVVYRTAALWQNQNHTNEKR